MDITFSSLPPGGKSTHRKEDEIQQSLWAWLALVKADKGGLSLQDFAYMVPNGTYLGGGSPKARARYIAKLKSMGFRPGVSDIVLALPRHGYHGAYLELKKDPGSGWGLREEQAEWLQRMWSVGYWVSVCRGFEQACEDVHRYLEGLDPRDAVQKRLNIRA